MVIALVLVLVITGIDLLKTIILGYVIDLFAEQSGYELIFKAAIFYLGLLAIGGVCNMLQTWILQRTGQNIIYNIRQEVFEHVEKLSLRFFDITPVGKIVTRITNDVEALHEMYATILVKLLRNCVKIIGLATMMLILTVQIALFAFIVIPFVVAFTFFFNKLSRSSFLIS